MCTRQLPNGASLMKTAPWLLASTQKGDHLGILVTPRPNHNRRDK